ncbi:hypothetical protein WJX84_004852 [Apatococcus fuscideae]|uniref:Uncharacterized protein n=1 Tax=Apatococcus fuscideae TaxID=2026836 RepID=A0AAW1SS31_9CHLO
MFVLEKVSSDESCVGVQWHCEIQGSEFPFSRGCSFYEVNAAGKITRARDLVESALKPGSLALQALALLAPVVRKLGPKANPGNLNKLPKTSIALAGCTLVYWYLFFASRILPGVPSWEAPPEQYKEILNQSINFWYCNNAFEAAGWPHIPNEAQHPVSEAIFNFAGAWSFMLLPPLHLGPQKQTESGTVTAILFLTNFLMFPYMALRALPVDKPIEEQGPRPPEVPLPGMTWVPWVPAVGWTSLSVAAMSVWWALAARPEVGGLAERWSYFQEAISNDRAFCVSIADILLYSVWQPVLMAETGWKWRKVPFFGLASWLVNVNVQRQVADEGMREQETGYIKET